MDLGVSPGMLTALLLASVRAAAWLTLCPPFNSGGIPSAVKALLSVSIAVPIAPGLAGRVPVDLSTGMLLANVAEQVVIGAALGFVTQILFAAVQSAGNLIDVFGGFSVAFAFDPLSRTGGGVFGRFYNVTATALLFATEGHQMVLRGFAQSYKALPVTDAISMTVLNHTLGTAVGQMFVASLQIAGPLIAVLFATDIALGLLSRAAPALNPFNLGFPAKILLTLTVAGTALMLLPGSLASLVEKAVHAVLQISQK